MSERTLNPNNNPNNNSNNYCNIKRFRTIYTLGGSQPYVATKNWPNNFRSPGVSFEPDTSLINLQTYNQAGIITTNKYNN